MLYIQFSLNKRRPINGRTKLLYLCVDKYVTNE